MNTKRGMSERMSQVAVLLPGAIGSAVILRAIAVYLGVDPVACLIMGVMAIGFGAGVVELWLRSRRAYALGREVEALPRKVTETTLDKVSPALKAFLRARIEHAPPPAASENLTPYLVGLMVMLGLLGTLLGLFETLHGAGQALTASADVNALRSGLSGPMRGLTRSFGCSAAGVSASAMLGLASVFVRRAEATAWARAQSYATGPLRELSPMRRQLDSFQQLAQQGEALPRAAQALEQATTLLGQLAERWENAHRTSQESQQKTAQELMQRMREELARTAAEAGRAVSEGVTPLLKQVVGQTGDALTRQMSAAREALDKDVVARREALDKDLALRWQVLDKELSSRREALDMDLASRSQTDSAMRESLREELALARKETQEHLSALAGAARTLSQQLEDEARDRRTGADRMLSELAERLDASVAQRAEESRRELVALATLGEQLVSSHETREVALKDRWDQMVDRVQADLGQLAERIGSDLAARAERDRDLTVSLDQAIEKLQLNAEGLSELLSKQEGAVQELVEKSAGHLRELGEATQAGALEALSQLVKLGEEHAARFVQLELLLRETQVQHTQGLAGELTGHAERLSKGLESTTALVQEAATVLRASSVEMGAVAGLFHQSVERQREAAQAWMESLGELEGAVERAGRGAAADALGDQLASTQEVFARQLQFQRELFEQLRTLRGAGVASAGPGKGEHDVSA